MGTATTARQMMRPQLHDSDFSLYIGDCRQILPQLPDDSINCVVTSPPYWGLRDYGTGEWEGGDPMCPHKIGNQVQDNKAPGAITSGVRPGVDGSICPRCGATRKDFQLGLEPTPERYVDDLVGIFREVRRVLRPDGSCWLNLGDSYAGGGGGNYGTGLSVKAHGTHPASSRDKGSRNGSGLPWKNLVGIPWRVAFALQADGWYLRCDIIWSKPNPMPESITDRPTKSHEYLFLLTKSPHYYFDQEAVREPYMASSLERSRYPRDDFRSGSIGHLRQSGEKATKGGPRRTDLPAAPPDRPQSETLDGSDGEAPRGADGRRKTTTTGRDNSLQHRDGERWPQSGRNIRSVWVIPTQPYQEAHFATFPEALVERCLKAGCPTEICGTCGQPRQRLTETRPNPAGLSGGEHREPGRDGGIATNRPRDYQAEETIGQVVMLGWSDCGHDNYRPGVVLDPFLGSGTTAHVARKLGLHAVGIELNENYGKLIADRTQQLSLLS